MNRRLHPRAVVRWTAAIRPRGATGWEPVILHDLSAGGAAVHAGAPLAVQTEVRLRFQVPSEGERPPVDVQVHCLVVRAGAPDPPDPQRPHLAGLHFLDLQGAAFDAVRVHVWSLVS